MNSVLKQTAGEQFDLGATFRDSHVADVLDQLDAELVGLAPVKSRIRDICALLLVDTLRRQGYIMQG